MVWRRTLDELETIYKVTESVCAESKRRKLPNPQFHITSNGTLLTQEIANYCASRNFSWIISIDGPQAMHDANRPYKDGRGTYDEVMRGLVFLKRAYEGRPNPITLRGTFDKENPDVLQAVKHLNELMYQGFGAHVSVEPSTLGEGSTTKSRLEGLLIKEIRSLFTPQYEETARWFVKEIKEGRKPSLHHFQMPMQRLLDRDPAFTECGAGMGYVSVGPQGKICACHREHRTDIGNMATGIDPRKVSKWRDNRFYVRNMCNTCWRRLICGGGCRVNSLLENNKINDPSIVNCVFTDIQQRCAMWILSELTMEERKMYSKDGFGLMSPFLQPGRQPFVVPTQNNYAELGINPKDVMPPAQPIGESPACQKSCQYDCQANCMFSDQAAAQEALKRQQLQGNRCACSGEQKQGALSQLGVQQSQDGHCACSGEDQKECACFRGEKKEPHTPSNDD